MKINITFFIQFSKLVREEKIIVVRLTTGYGLQNGLNNLSFALLKAEETIKNLK